MSFNIKPKVRVSKHCRDRLNRLWSKVELPYYLYTQGPLYSIVTNYVPSNVPFLFTTESTQESLFEDYSPTDSYYRIARFIEAINANTAEWCRHITDDETLEDIRKLAECLEGRGLRDE